MKAIVCPEYGPVYNLDYRDLPDPTPGPGEVVITAEAIGVNYPDGLLVQGLYQMKPETPFVPGMEAAGIVEAVGDDVIHVRPGDRVVTLLSLGGYAEKVLAPADKVFPIPASMSFADACALMCAWGTSHHALRQRAHLKPKLFAGEAGVFFARLKRLAALYVLLGVLFLILAIFVMIALFIWCAQNFGALPTALGFCGGTVVLLLLTFVMIIIVRRRPSTRADDRLQRDIASIAGVTAISNAPQILRAFKRNRGLVAVPVAVAGVYGLYRFVTGQRDPR